MSQTLPTHAQTVIIGGGSIGCNTAYQLTKLGMSDVVVLERDRLTSGTTWHAAGLIVGGLLKSEAECEIYLEGRRLYSEIEKETGVPTGFRDVGYIQLATNEVQALLRWEQDMLMPGQSPSALLLQRLATRLQALCEEAGASAALRQSWFSSSVSESRFSVRSNSAEGSRPGIGPGEFAVVKRRLY